MQDLPKVTERILLHLARYSKRQIETVAPWAMTQEGIASAIRIMRRNVAMPLKRLIEEGSVAVHKRHVKGARTVRKVYSLTPKGMTAAKDISEKTGGLVLSVIDLDGNVHQAAVKDVGTFLTVGSDILDIMLATHDGVFDCGEFQQSEARAERRLVDMTERMPLFRRFFGRSEELSRLLQFSRSSTHKACVITGLPGIGKTALVVSFISEMKREASVFWLRVHEWNGLFGFLSALGEFLSAQGRPALLRYLESAEEIDLDMISFMLRSDLPGVSGIGVLDDFHKAEPEIVDCVKVIFDLLVENDSNFKLIIVGRSVPKFYDVRALLIRRSVLELAIERIDDESARRILMARGIPTRFHERAIALAMGHPLYLELVEPSSSIGSPEFMEFIETEVFESLDLVERDMMMTMALARYPLLPEAFLLTERVLLAGERGRLLRDVEREIQSCLISLQEKNLLIAAAYGTLDSHDLLKEFFARKTAPELRKEIHSALAQYYLDDSSPFSAAEAIHHLTLGGNIETASEVASHWADEIISRVGYQPLKEFVESCLERHDKQWGASDFLLVKAKVEEAEGDWNSALESIERTLEAEAARNREAAPDLLRLQGSILLRKGDLVPARELLMRARERAEAVKDHKLLATI